jgi:DNA-binding NarL/FixJ family response regulator
MSMVRGKPPVFDILTPIEERIWNLYRQGKKREEIAAAMGLKATTIANRLSIIKDKVAVK